MGEAFDALCEVLHHTGQSEIVQEVMARRIIAAARKGERNLTKRRDAALVAMPTNVSAAEGSPAHTAIGFKMISSAGLSSSYMFVI